MNRHRKSVLFLLSSLWLILLIPPRTLAQEWGTILTARSKVNIRAERSLNTEIRGTLKAGETVKADFLKNGWYAVFRPEERIRNEARALGYVRSLRLAAPAPLPKKAESTEGKEILPVKDPLSGAIVVKSITFKKEASGREKVLIEFNRFNAPRIFGIDGANPRIVIDIANVSSAGKGLTRIRAGGKLVRQIRTALNRTTSAMRIVIDMEPNLGYDVDQTYYKAENIYAVEISEAPKKPAGANPGKATP